MTDPIDDLIAGEHQRQDRAIEQIEHPCTKQEAAQDYRLGFEACSKQLEALRAEFERYRRCLYRANGRLIQLSQEPEKLDYEAKP